MKVFARLFQKAAGAWGSAPSRARRREIPQTLFSFAKQICSSLLREDESSPTETLVQISLSNPPRPP